MTQGRNLEGTTLAHRYLIGEVLGEGAMGSAYRAYDRVRGTDVALKLLSPRAPELIDAFRREFLMLAGVSHPGLVEVYDFAFVASEETHCFHTARLIDGIPLADHAAVAGFDACLPPLRDALSALDLLHHLGLRHGDFKPDNILVEDRRGDGADAAGVLVDLGCGQRLDAQPSFEVSGTPGFIAPELFHGHADRRSDLFAVGATIEALAKSARTKLPPALAELAARLTAEDPADRPADVAAVLEAMGFSALAPASPGGLRSTLVGRDGELESARRILGALVNRPGKRVVFIHGQEGIGKSRLLLEIKWLAQQHFETYEAVASAAQQHRHGVIADMLARAVGMELPATVGVDWLLGVRDQMVAAGKPAVLIVDDVHRLDRRDRDALLTFARSIDDADPIAIFAACDQPPLAAEAAIELLPLGPVAAAALERWIGGLLPTAKAAEVVRDAGGVPGEVLAALGEADRGASAAALLRTARVEKLPEGTRTALAALAALDGRATQDLLAAVGVDVRALAALSAWVVREGNEVRLRRRSDASRIAEAVGGPSMTTIHRGIADELARVASRIEEGGHQAHGATGGGDALIDSGRVHGQRILHLFRAGDEGEAGAVLTARTDDARARPDLYAEGCRALVATIRALPTDVATLAVEVLSATDEPEKVLAHIETIRLRKLGDEEAARLLAAAGSCHARLGRSELAVQMLEQARTTTADRMLAARHGDELSLALVRQGRHGRAREVALESLHADLGPELRARLLCHAGTASSYLGQTSESRSYVREALDLLRELDAPRGRAQALIARGLLEYRAGQAIDAERAWSEALALATEHGLTADFLTLLSNLGTVSHQLGNWGRALTTYEQGLRMAHALGHGSLTFTLGFNLAKLFSDIGQLERARHHAEHTRDAARETRPFMAAAAISVLAECAVADGDLEAAAKLFEQAEEGFSRDGAGREIAEVAVELARTELARGREKAAAKALGRAEAVAENSDAPDLLARYLITRAEASAAAGDLTTALSDCEAALAHAERAAQRQLVAEVNSRFATIARRAGDPERADRHSVMAQALWGTIAASLPVHLREAFARHPLRRNRLEVAGDAILQSATGAARGQRASALPASGPDAMEAPKLRRLLQINRRLLAAKTAAEILEAAMEAAVELVGAERGFLILREARTDRRKTSRLKVAVARNIDREHIGKSHLKFSHAITEKVIESGEPLITVDAADDPRFRKNRSVHAMRLKSVVCVPIRTADAIIGAIYLDNRFRRGGFDGSDVELLVDFATTVALTLMRARTLADLEERSKDLATERARVERLMAGQAERIDVLEEQLASQREVLAHRYDYHNIVGTSPAMQRVFETLDRVIPTALTILVQGESGTGKELIARALHFNGPRQDGHFVAVNCGALPDTLLEAELFGYRRGAFTGAVRDHDGLFVAANGGTLFLDELGEMSKGMQVKLLRVLQEHEVRPVGASQPSAVDVRLVCATNRDLKLEVSQGRFREDLYYRVAVVEVALPPLRDRIEDIPALAERILAGAAERAGRKAPLLTGSAVRALSSHAWPGNVRQLENVLTRACLLAEGKGISAADLGLDVEDAATKPRRGFRPQEATRMRSALVATGWNVAEAARALDIPRASFYRKLKRYGIERDG